MTSFVHAAIEQPHPVSYSRACRELGGISRRHLRRLIRPGRRVRAGRAQLTRESLNRELDRRKVDIEADIGELLRDSDKQKRTCSIPERAEVGHADTTMLARIPRSAQRDATQLAELVSVPFAAALVGISDEALCRAVKAGQLPSISAGKRAKINVAVLKAWANADLAGR